ncbi:hypothetical protein KZ326_06665 [Glaesserella parasuis]|nr:hypothetical protein [Glaesserella parasuis]
MTNTLEQAQNMVAKYLEAEEAILSGRTVSFNGRSVSYESLSEIRKGREFWESRLAQLQQRQANRGRGSRFKLARFG